VNKADLPGADRTVQALELMLELESGPRPLRHHGQWLALPLPPQPTADHTSWQVTVLKTNAASGEGIDALRVRFEAHWAWLHASGEISHREQVRIATTIEQIVRAELNRRIRAQLPQPALQTLIEQVRGRTTDPYTVAAMLLQDN
jgi:LAO/AO transport system kinase